MVHLELLTVSSHFSSLSHVLFFSALFLPEDVWEAFVCVQVSVCMCGAATCFRILLTHVYCHHQEVALLNSSTELNFSRRAKISSWEQRNKNAVVSTSNNCATFPPLGAHNISVIAQKQWQNRTQVVVSTQSFFFFQYQCHRFCYLFNLYLTRMVSWDWHILFWKVLANK